MKRYDLEWTGPAYMQYQEMQETEHGDWCDVREVAKILYLARCLAHSWKTGNRPREEWVDVILEETDLLKETDI